MAELKTKPTAGNVSDFLDAIDDPDRQKDCRALAKLMRRVTGKQAKMWGPSIVGFGTYHYKYATGREGDWFLTGFSPRKRDLALYIMAGFSKYDALMKELGPHKTGKSCLYIKRLADVDMDVLTELIDRSAKHVAKNGGP